eukprot:CAMPEP_0114289358 /NCGR_PEP_ID=MMETSP0059-20121206/7327_1 /TAXON_ID=36894 /ORGANISM="Pyramimonas parkeae, Strain CCMP726" /LENGTH=281 /DNA_ID=CAMNT_0001410617 /DNA_START=23 /DNA_END=868 /DNA_ORIENTATION=-
MSASSLHLVVWTLPRTPPRTKSNHRHQGLHHSTGRVGVFSRKSCSTVCTLDQGVLGPSIQRSGGVVEGSRAASWLNGRKEARNNISESFVFGDPKKAWTGVVPVSFSIIHAVPAGDELLLIGSTKELGSWDADQALHMRRTEGNIWTASTSLPYEKFEFKVALKLANGRVHWQPTAGNAVLDVAALKTVTRDSVVGVKLSWSTTLVDVKLLRVRIAKRDPGAIESPEAKVILYSLGLCRFFGVPLLFDSSTLELVSYLLTYSDMQTHVQQDASPHIFARRN